MNPVEQRDAALRRGNEVREKRAAMKRELRTGAISLAYALRANKWYTENMSVRELLVSVPRLGNRKASKILDELKLTGCSLQEVSMQRREDLLAFIAEHHPSVNVGARVLGAVA